MNLNRDTAGASDQFRISVVPGNASYVAAADGTLSATGLIGDGTLLDWQIFTAVNATPFTGATVSAGSGLYFGTATCADTTAGGPQEWFDVWTTSDILTQPADIGTGLTPAVGNGPTPLTGNVKISGIESGKFFVMHGNFGTSARVNMTMTGPGQTPIVLPTYLTESPGSQNRMWLMEFTFANPNGNYYNIQWTVDNNQNNTGRRRTGGIFLDGTLYVDTIEPVWVATWPNAGPVSSTLFTLNGNINENGTAYYVVLPDGAAAPTSAQVKAGNDASSSPAPFSGNFALSALVPGTKMITGLTASTAYDVYVVAEDVRGPNLQATPVLVDVTTTPPDLTAPNWTATYPQQSRTPAGLTGIGNLDEAGTAYFVALPSGASAPTSAQVKAGTDASDVAAPSGGMALPSAGISGTKTIAGLTIGATYDVWFVAEDLLGNLQAAPASVASAPAAPVSQFVTGGFAWGTASVWSATTLGPYTGPWGSGNNAVFEGGSGVVAVASGTVVNDITFNSNSWILQGGPLTLAGTTQPIINVNANTPVFENPLAGTQGFKKTGSGTLQIKGTNSITGGIVIDGGSLNTEGNATALNNNDITANAGALGLTLTGGTTTNGGITINATTLSISNNNSSVTVNGAVTGAGGITLNKTGDGQNFLNLLSTANTFTGGVDYTGNRSLELNVNSFADSASSGAGKIRFGLGTPSDFTRRNRFALQSGAIAPVTLTNRQFEIASTGGDYPAQIYNNSARRRCGSQHLRRQNRQWHCDTGPHQVRLRHLGALRCQ
jgi:autotransporter-associated beta strand protein